MKSGRWAALILLSAFYLIQVAALELVSVTEVGAGDSVTLTCSESKERSYIFYWYRLRFGYELETIAVASTTNIRDSGENGSERLKVSKADGTFLLNIVNASREDEAMYFCQIGSSYKMETTNSTFLVVDGRKNKPNSLQVRQNPESESVWPGGRVTLQCLLRSRDGEDLQCPQRRSVFWFRAVSAGAHPVMIYTHGNQSDQDQERSCEYSLPKTIHSSDAGTYYCAVMACGRILFGPGTQVYSKEPGPVIAVLLALLVCSLAGNVVQTCRSRRWQNSKETPVIHDEEERSATELPNMCGEDEAMSYATVNFRLRNAPRWDSNDTDCIYSGLTEGNI